MRVGYARVSTTEQSIDAQLERLKDCEKVFHEKLSGKKDDRPELARALEFVREGDTLVATRLDRLARSVSHMCQIGDTLQQKHVELVILDQAIDTSTPAGKFLFHILAAVAELQLSLYQEAHIAGIAHARATGKRTGRLPALTLEELQQVSAWRLEGMPTGMMARKLHVDRSTVYRALKREDGLAPPYYNKPLRSGKATSGTQAG